MLTTEFENLVVVYVSQANETLSLRVINSLMNEPSSIIKTHSLLWITK